LDAGASVFIYLNPMVRRGDCFPFVPKVYTPLSLSLSLSELLKI